MTSMYEAAVSAVKQSVRKRGLVGRGGTFLLEDDLVRAVQVTPLQKTSDFVRLDVLVSLGIPGLSEFTGRRRLWAVTAHLSRVMQKDQATSDLTLDGSAEDDRRIERIVSYVDRMSE